MPPTPITIRSAAPSDALCLSVLGMHVFLDTYVTEGIRPSTARKVTSSFSEPVIAQAIASPSSVVLVAERLERLIALAHVNLDTSHAMAPAGTQAELLRLYVQTPFLRSGVGSSLLASAERAATERGASVLWLTPWVHNAGALAFYNRRGYQDLGPIESPSFEGTSHPNRFLAKLLRGAA